MYLFQQCYQLAVPCDKVVYIKKDTIFFALVNKNGHMFINVCDSMDEELLQKNVYKIFFY